MTLTSAKSESKEANDSLFAGAAFISAWQGAGSGAWSAFFPQEIGLFAKVRYDIFRYIHDEKLRNDALLGPDSAIASRAIQHGKSGRFGCIGAKLREEFLLCGGLKEEIAVNWSEEIPADCWGSRDYFFGVSGKCVPASSSCDTFSEQLFTHLRQLDILMPVRSEISSQLRPCRRSVLTSSLASSG